MDDLGSPGILNERNGKRAAGRMRTNGRSGRKQAPAFAPADFLAKVTLGKSAREYRQGQGVFAQGDTADAVFFIEAGKVRLTVVSSGGKQAIIAVVPRGQFFGEGSLAGQPLRMSTADAVEPSTLVRVQKKAMNRLLRREPDFAELFIAHLLSRNVRIEEDLVDQLFNSSERRLARVLLRLAHFGKVSKPQVVVPKMSQETLAAMVGTTRSRVSYFMNRFRKMGFIDYSGNGLRVHNGLLSVVLGD
jgi:CRP-like cAMP-binding protein